MKKQLSPPSNWQDFEDLCKRLFGEIWNCRHSISKHGRQGQKQYGVDVYGRPEGEKGYWGIQCKGKASNYGKILTKSEIDAEIQNAKLFEPSLKVFIFATTAAKDQEIERYVRVKNLESEANGGFQILLKDWEDLSDEIRRNKTTYDYYINNQDFESQHKINVQFIEGNSEITIYPKFVKRITNYATKLSKRELMEKQIRRFDTLNELVENSFLGGTNINRSWCKIEMFIENVGSISLEDWKLWLQVDSNVRKISDTSKSGSIEIINPRSLQYRTTFAYKEKMQILYSPFQDRPLVPRDSQKFEWYLIPKYDSTEINITWELLSQNLSLEGTLKININPDYKIENKTILVNNESEVRSSEEISDFIEKK
jgi:hypothetical protein